MTTLLGSERGKQLLALARREIGSRLGVVVGNGDHSLDGAELKEKRSTFVTLKQRGKLRGCIGSLEASEPLVDSIRQNALNAAFHDHRFSPLSESEFGEVQLEISILTEPQQLHYHSPDDLLERLRPGIDGVILQSGRSRATFLPQVWEQLPDPEQFLEHLCRKAGLAPSSWRSKQVLISCYQVQSFAEEG